MSMPLHALVCCVCQPSCVKPHVSTLMCQPPCFNPRMLNLVGHTSFLASIFIESSRLDASVGYSFSLYYMCSVWYYIHHGIPHDAYTSLLCRRAYEKECACLCMSSIYCACLCMSSIYCKQHFQMPCMSSIYCNPPTVLSSFVCSLWAVSGELELRQSRVTLNESWH